MKSVIKIKTVSQKAVFYAHQLTILKKLIVILQSMINQFNMEPVVTQKNNQWFVVVLLIIILLTLLAGYIYYGIYLAKQNNQSVEVVPSVNNPDRLSDEERGIIQAELEAEAAPLPPMVRESIMTELEAEATPLAPEERAKILKSMDNN